MGDAWDIEADGGQPALMVEFGSEEHDEFDSATQARGPPRAATGCPEMQPAPLPERFTCDAARCHRHARCRGTAALLSRTRLQRSGGRPHVRQKARCQPHAGATFAGLTLGLLGAGGATAHDGERGGARGGRRRGRRTRGAAGRGRRPAARVHLPGARPRPRPCACAPCVSFMLAGSMLVTRPRPARPALRWRAARPGRARAPPGCGKQLHACRRPVAAGLRQRRGCTGASSRLGTSARPGTLAASGGGLATTARVQPPQQKERKKD